LHRKIKTTDNESLSPVKKPGFTIAS